MRVIISLFLIFFSVVNSGYCSDWFDDYVTTQSGTSYYETQRQGHLSLGGGSVRIKTERTPLLNITAPRIQAGCGGIDAFWGGLNYMKPEYLVQAFQNIMSAAPAFAFKIALKVLCQQCDDVMTSLESMANLINQMAMDECGAARALVNMGGNYVANKLNLDAESGSLVKDTWLGNSLSTLQSSIGDAKNWLDNFYSTEFCGFNGEEDSSIIGPCKYFASFGQLPKSFWHSLSVYINKKSGGSNSLFNGCEQGSAPSCSSTCKVVPFLNALFGDVVFKKGKNQSDTQQRLVLIKSEYIPPVDNKSASEWLKMLLDYNNSSSTSIKTHYMTNSGQYTDCDLDISDLKFGQKSSQAIEKIADAIRTGDSSYLDSATQKFINEQVFPLWKIINIFAYQGESSLNTIQNSVLVKYAAISNAFYFLNEISYLAESHAEKHLNTLLDGSEYAPVNKEELERNIKTLRNKILSFRRELVGEYRNLQSDFYTAMTNVTQLTALEREITARLVNNFGYSPLQFYK